jgi:hypothetical protein
MDDPTPQLQARARAGDANAFGAVFDACARSACCGTAGEDLQYEWPLGSAPALCYVRVGVTSFAWLCYYLLT